jgi:hypothetical protein
MFGVGNRSVLLLEETDKNGDSVTRVIDIRVQEISIDRSIYGYDAPEINVRGLLLGGEEVYRKGSIKDQFEIDSQKAITNGEEEIVIAELIED